ncbi:hypothetical protein [Labrys monachus]|uniref:Uncharacterized protein n=1 Tax=Labrys monachus TaxID=217067 RepID=A0ABU0FMP9_9HYPH|nr:hypothetical protein [Labrys monachus]MDQ0395890.1 hypothetical protein [Labrys monachus]
MKTWIQPGCALAGLLTLLAAGTAAAQQAQQPPAQQPPIPQVQQTPAQPVQQGPRWDSLPLMKLEAYYRGPLMDTVIQRWRDPVDGSICYLYMPISAEHTQTPNSPYVQYGAHQIGSISCFAQPMAAPAAAPAPPRSRSSKPKAPASKPREAPAQ